MSLRLLRTNPHTRYVPWKFSVVRRGDVFHVIDEAGEFDYDYDSLQEAVRVATLLSEDKMVEMTLKAIVRTSKDLDWTWAFGPDAVAQVPHHRDVIVAVLADMLSAQQLTGFESHYFWTPDRLRHHANHLVKQIRKFLPLYV